MMRLSGFFSPSHLIYRVAARLMKCVGSSSSCLSLVVVVVVIGVWSVLLARGLVPTLLRLPEAENGWLPWQALATKKEALEGREAKQQAMGTVFQEESPLPLQRPHHIFSATKQD
jgi:hypothetical protein